MYSYPFRLSTVHTCALRALALCVSLFLPLADVSLTDLFSSNPDISETIEDVIKYAWHFTATADLT